MTGLFAMRLVLILVIIQVEEEGAAEEGYECGDTDACPPKMYCVS